MEQNKEYKEMAKELLMKFPMLDGVSYIAPFLVLSDHEEITINQMGALIYGRDRDGSRTKNASVIYPAVKKLIETGFVERRGMKVRLTGEGRLFINHLRLSYGTV